MELLKNRVLIERIRAVDFLWSVNVAAVRGYSGCKGEKKKLLGFPTEKKVW